MLTFFAHRVGQTVYAGTVTYTLSAVSVTETGGTRPSPGVRGTLTLPVDRVADLVLPPAFTL